MARIFFGMVAVLRHDHILAHVLMTLGALSHVGKHVGVLKVEKATRLTHQAVREERVPDRTEKYSEKVGEVWEPSSAGISWDNGSVLEETSFRLLEVDVGRDI